MNSDGQLGAVREARHHVSRWLLLLVSAILGANVLAAERPQSTRDFKVVIEGPAILQRLRPLVNLEKDQYEKTIDFTKRVCTETHKTLGVDKSTPITFVLEHGKYATSADYNADKQAFFVKLGTEIHYIDSGAPYEDRWRFQPYIDKFKFNTVWLARTYAEAPKPAIGKNAFGVTKEIKIQTEEMAVLFFPTKNFANHSTFIGSRILLPAKPEAARQLDGDLRVAMVARIYPPCFVTGRSHQTPKISFPYDRTIFEMGIVVNPNPEWILYRASTREILKRGVFK